MPSRNALLGAPGLHCYHCPVQPCRNVSIRRCSQHRFFLRSPIRRDPPHAQNTSFRPRLTDAVQRMSRSARDFFVRKFSEQREFSEHTARVIDEEVQKFMVQANTTAIEMLTQNRVQLDAIAKALLDNEAIDERDMEQIIGTRPASNSNDSVLKKSDEA